MFVLAYALIVIYVVGGAFCLASSNKEIKRANRRKQRTEG